MTTLASFFAHGRPAPQGSKRHVGKGIMVESSKKVAPWREAVKQAFLASGQTATRYEGAVVASVSFLFQKPKSAPKSRRVYPSTRGTGDIEKLLRSTFDALVDVGVLRDDSQIVRLSDVTKDYASDGQALGALIIITSIDAEAP